MALGTGVAVPKVRNDKINKKQPLIEPKLLGGILDRAHKRAAKLPSKISHPLVGSR